MTPLLAVAVESEDRSMLAVRLFTYREDETFDEEGGLVKLAVEASIALDVVLVMN